MKTELSITDRASLVPLIAQAMQSDVDPAKLRALLDVRRDWEADEARKAFSRAIAEFQRRAPIIPKADKGDKNSYAKIDRIWRTVCPVLSDLGMSVTWQVAELRDNIVHVEGALRHRDGHSERLVSDIPVADVIRNKEGRAVTNAAQMVGSARSYAQRYALCAALGIVTGEDDDGEAAGACYVSQEQAAEIAELLDACRGIHGFAEDAFWRWLGIHDEGQRNALNIHLDRYADTVRALRAKLGRTA